MKELGQQQEQQYPKSQQEDYSKPTIQHCQFPICPIHSNSKYCIRRAVGSVVPEVIKKVYNIPPRSKKRIAEQKEYVAIVKDKLSKNNKCELNSPVCTGIADGLDHIQKRSPSNFLAIDNLKNCCSPCNLYKELNPKWANDNGFSISRFKK